MKSIYFISVLLTAFSLTSCDQFAGPDDGGDPFDMRNRALKTGLLHTADSLLNEYDGKVTGFFSILRHGAFSTIELNGELGFGERNNTAIAVVRDPVTETGIDMGEVFIDGTPLEKLEDEDFGVFYILSSRFSIDSGDGFPYDYQPDHQYHFEATGADNFDPFELTLNAPDDLAVTSPENGEHIFLTDDLTIEWNGEHEAVTVRLIPHREFAGGVQIFTGHAYENTVENPAGSITIPSDELVKHFEAIDDDFTHIACDLQTTLFDEAYVDERGILAIVNVQDAITLEVVE